MDWEATFDCNVKMRDWLLEIGVVSHNELLAIEKDIKTQVRNGKKAAWQAFVAPQKQEQQQAIALLTELAKSSKNKSFIDFITNELAAEKEPLRRSIAGGARKALRYVINEQSQEKEQLQNWLDHYFKIIQPSYSSNLYSESAINAKTIAEVLPTYDAEAEDVDARIIIRDNFDAIFSKHPEALVFGEDAGTIGDVNQGLEGMQEKYGEFRVSDTGIREATILGQGIGMAMRGLRPIAEIQYLDYILYALQIMSDDLVTVRYRSNGQQKAPLIVRTRGHRLEGIWHSGSQMGGLIHLLRGMYILVPRNMTKAAGFYNTLLSTDEPALVVECLNGYRLKEPLPTNFGEFKTPIGVIETIKQGTDITLVSYGSTIRIIEQAVKELKQVGIDAEVIDVQSLLPLDISHQMVKSIEKTNRLLVIDEDVPGGASAYILQHIVDQQNGYQHLDSKPQTLTATQHRPAYGTDGDYFSKPSAEDVLSLIHI